MPDSPAVVVIGGGPAGSTCSTILRQHGLTVDLFERETFPRFHIGESLIPMTYHVLKRTGMLDKMKASHFVKKYSVQFINQRGKLSEPFYFIDHKPHESSQTWQVRRSEFDHLNLKNAAEHGVRVHENARVIEVLFEGDRAVGVRVKVGDEPEKVVRAKVVVDASGQSTMLTDRLGLREWDPLLKKAAVWTYWKGAYRDQGRDEGATIVIQTEAKKGWFWYIPLHDDVVSVGVVADHDYLFKDRASKDLETIYFEEVAKAPGLVPRIKDAQRCDIFRAP
jgi:flavin-dependent dehydrogenase